MSSKHSSVIRTDLYSGLLNGLDTTTQLVVVDLRRHLSAVVLNGSDRAALPGQPTQSSLEVVDDAHATKSSSGRPWWLVVAGPGVSLVSKTPSKNGLWNHWTLLEVS